MNAFPLNHRRTAGCFKTSSRFMMNRKLGHSWVLLQRCQLVTELEQPMKILARLAQVIYKAYLLSCQGAATFRHESQGEQKEESVARPSFLHCCWDLEGWS